MVAPSSILESSTDAPDDRQLKNLKFQTPLATTKNGFPDTLLGAQERRKFLKQAFDQYDAAGRLQGQLVSRFPDADAYSAWLLQFQLSRDRLAVELGL